MATRASFTMILLCCIAAVGAVRPAVFEFDLGKQTLSQEEETEDSTNTTGCRDIDPALCQETLRVKGNKEAMCTKTWSNGGLDDDPNARGVRINFGPCHEASKRGYQYGAKAYAGGFEGRGDEGCCPKTCGNCRKTPPARKPAAAPAPARTPAASTPAFTHWCREWQDVMPDSCQLENNGKFFESVKGKNGKKKKRKSEIHRQNIDGWCCWPPEPTFAGPSGPCGSPNYYPGGTDCEQDFTCPKKYLISGNEEPVDIRPDQPCPNAR